MPAIKDWNAPGFPHIHNFEPVEVLKNATFLERPPVYAQVCACGETGYEVR